MPMSNEERARVLSILDDLDAAERGRVLSSMENFKFWLMRTMFVVYMKVKDSLEWFWKKFKGFFA